MCALQDCGSTPLLNSRSSAEATPSHFLTEPSSNNPDLITGFSDNCYDTPPAERENQADELSSEMLNTADFINIPSGFEEKQHFKSKNIFHIPDDYCSYEPAPAEIDHLLPSKTDKIHFVREAENLIDHSGKRAFTQRSISDYYLSKRYEEAKLTLPCTDATETKPNISSVVSPTAESYGGYATKGESSEFCTPSNSNCFIPPSGLLFEESGTVPTERRLSVQNECMPGTSGLGQATPEDGSASEKNLYKACNLNPTVNMKIFDTESLSESGDLATNGSSLAVDSCNQRVLDDAWFIPSSRHTFSGAELSGSASAAQLSIASSFGDSSTPTCKICHMPAKAEDPLISPCRCTGTLHYIHCGCLMRWLEICNKRSRKPPACELCKYQFHWHKKFKVRHWQFPHCSWRDKILHTVFLISVLVMIGCAIVTVMCFRQHRGNKADITHLELSQSEIITLICGALFFLAFFLAMYVEIKARNTIYKLLVKFIYLNQQWYIDEYDKKGENTVIDV